MWDKRVAKFNSSNSQRFKCSGTAESASHRFQIRIGSIMYFGRTSGCLSVSPSVFCESTHVLRDAISPYFVKRFERNSPRMFVVWMGIAEKRRGQKVNVQSHNQTECCNGGDMLFDDTGTPLDNYCVQGRIL